MELLATAPMLEVSLLEKRGERMAAGPEWLPLPRKWMLKAALLSARRIVRVVALVIARLELLSLIHI